ncbi:MAG TPA: zinc ribbon domain-containing protein [candidate division Zixibacteria bacterium]
MPIYEYVCDLCSTKFEVLQLSQRNEKPKCPECGSGQIRKSFSIFGFSSGGKFVSSSSGANCSHCGHTHCSHCG